MLIATSVVLTTLATPTPVEHCGFFGENDDQSIDRGEEILCNGMKMCSGPGCELAECNAICDSCDGCEGFSFIGNRKSGQGPICVFKTDLSANEEFGDFRAEEKSTSSGWEMFANSRATGGSCGGAMRESFDSLERLGDHQSSVNYPDGQFKAITACMATAGSTLYPSASDAAWAGWTQYGINGGAPDDPWSLDGESNYQEYDPQNLMYQGKYIPVIEPCNTLSNLAYYRILPDLCANRENLFMDDDYINAIVQGFATLGMGSSFLHASRTSLGRTFDTVPIDIIAYQYFQLMTESLSPGDTGSASVLHELSTTPRADNSRVLATKMHTIPINYELTDWLGALKALDTPEYYLTFASIILNILTVVAPDSIMDKLLPELIGLFGLKDDVKEFILEKFVPTIRAATANIELTISEKIKLTQKLMGTLIKLMYGFVWQEAIFKYDFIYNDAWNTAGAWLIPAVNYLSNALTGFKHPDSSIQSGKNVYPGQSECKTKKTAAHAKWHEISANGLMDLGYLADAARVTINAAQARGTRRVSGDETEVILTTEDIADWASDMMKLPWDDNYVITNVFALVVKGIVNDMDKCSTGKSDGSVTWSDLSCYTGKSSLIGFIDDLFKTITSERAQCMTGPYEYCCKTGTPCNCQKSKSASGQCSWLAYDYCCNVGTPCSCGSILRTNATQVQGVQEAASVFV